MKLRNYKLPPWPPDTGPAVWKSVFRPRGPAQAGKQNFHRLRCGPVVYINIDHEYGKFNPGRVHT